MQKSRFIKVAIPDDQQILTREENILDEQVRFDLYRKEKEIKEISQILKNLAVKETAERRWLQDNEGLATDLVEEFVEDSLYKLDGAQMNGETLELSVEVMSKLRETLGLFQAVIANSEELEA
ncbi:MAG: hypothetical protein A2383_00940 [Candidatus Pacebacteria bacterium RIFOXYB1_FULL_39_46]|nr:MAG: hypothetical protein A2182_00775 [Candidatus Pacebacteria bacterium RIFOXYA1_FULL_38_18]OGJ38148.1 MAG: hypothetical protein A2383_00940 [Candidatus Pacebacteria bacterium RIFOXYB1_FULL_39_46]OGJ39630.1 MAG: hypothetical protein A2411_02500 [Candidatus Pacebacteria bacterium RIFOXYC1_FULL_39_21]OGJ39900.1 MAG: hypothetical protein A2582_00705 [Candidatus Pacebacteria bacterium RIFOXYD1_FULL_39_27]